MRELFSEGVGSRLSELEGKTVSQSSKDKGVVSRLRELEGKTVSRSSKGGSTLTFLTGTLAI